MFTGFFFSQPVLTFAVGGTIVILLSRSIQPDEAPEALASFPQEDPREGFLRFRIPHQVNLVSPHRYA